MRLILMALLVMGSGAPALAQDAQTGGTDGPAVRRLKQMMAATESGDAERIRAFIRDAYAPDLRSSLSEERVVQSYLDVYRRTRGFEIVTMRATETEAAVLVRSKLTGLTEPLSVRVAAEPPHPIVGSASLRLESTERLVPADASDGRRVREIERIARTLHQAEVFSGNVLVAKGHTVLYLGSFGTADPASGTPLTPDARFDMASLTKMFVTVAIAQLAEQGKLSWDDPLGKFFPDFPLAEAREKVRIRHLVTHTSGLQDSLRYCERNPCPQTYATMDDYVRLAGRVQETSLQSEPGTVWRYTNITYALLGAIVERVTGQPFYEYIHKRVFRPARMSRSGFVAKGKTGPRLVQPQQNGTAPALRAAAPAASYPAPFCCAHSTVRDLLRFANALRTGRLVRPETVRLLFADKPEAGSWAYGFDILDAERGIVGHSGSWQGLSNSLDLFTRSGYTAVVLSNRTNGRTPLREAIRAILP